MRNIGLKGDPNIDLFEALVFWYTKGDENLLRKSQEGRKWLLEQALEWKKDECRKMIKGMALNARKTIDDIIINILKRNGKCL